MYIYMHIHTCTSHKTFIIDIVQHKWICIYRFIQNIKKTWKCGILKFLSWVIIIDLHAYMHIHRNSACRHLAGS